MPINIQRAAKQRKPSAVPNLDLFKVLASKQEDSDSSSE